MSGGARGGVIEWGVRPILLVMMVAACAQAGVVPGEGRTPTSQYPGQFYWGYDKGIASAEGARHPTPVDVPNPAMEKLAATKTAMIDMPASIEGAVRFCVDAAGKTKRVETEGPTGDPKLDKALREAVQAWTFTPAALAGRAVEACSTATFVMSFR